MADLPLAGLNIVVTRPRDQAPGLMRRIEQLGGTPLLFPLLEIEPVPDDQTIREQLGRLGQTDIAIFISPNAVRYGMAAVLAAGTLPSTLKFAAVGPGSARALQEKGIAHVITPQARIDSEGLLAEQELQDVAGQRVMIFRGDGGRELLGDTLRARGATVEYVTCYTRSKADLDMGALLQRQPHVLTVSSSEALQHLWETLGKSGNTELAGLPIFLTHERIAAKARQQGWRNVMVGGSGDDGLLSSLIAWAHTKRN
jgi:uroporphyrinogen-III synthase